MNEKGEKLFSICDLIFRVLESLESHYFCFSDKIVLMNKLLMEIRKENDLNIFTLSLFKTYLEKKLIFLKEVGKINDIPGASLSSVESKSVEEDMKNMGRQARKIKEVAKDLLDEFQRKNTRPKTGSIEHEKEILYFEFIYFVESSNILDSLKTLCKAESQRQELKRCLLYLIWSYEKAKLVKSLTSILSHKSICEDIITYMEKINIKGSLELKQFSDDEIRQMQKFCSDIKRRIILESRITEKGTSESNLKLLTKPFACYLEFIKENLIGGCTSNLEIRSSRLKTILGVIIENPYYKLDEGNKILLDILDFMLQLGMFFDSPFLEENYFIDCLKSVLNHSKGFSIKAFYDKINELSRTLEFQQSKKNKLASICDGLWGNLLKPKKTIIELLQFRQRSGIQSFDEYNFKEEYNSIYSNKNSQFAIEIFEFDRVTNPLNIDLSCKFVRKRCKFLYCEQLDFSEIIREGDLLHKCQSKNGVIKLLGMKISTNDDHSKLIVDYILEKYDFDLGEYLNVNNTISNEIKLSLIKGISKSLKKIHALNIIHGDIKSENFLVKFSAEKVRVAIIDFGGSREKKDDKSIQTIYGYTALYAAPELRGSTQAGQRSDVFSMGIIILTILFGKFYNSQLGVYLEKCKRGGFTKLWELLKSMTDEDYNKRLTSLEVFNRLSKLEKLS